MNKIASINVEILGIVLPDNEDAKRIPVSTQLKMTWPLSLGASIHIHILIYFILFLFNSLVNSFN